MPSIKPFTIAIALLALFAVAVPVAQAQDTEGPDQSAPWALLQSIIDTETTRELVDLIHPDDRDTLPDDLDMSDPSPAEDLKNCVILEVRTDRGWAVVFIEFEPKNGDFDYASIPMVRWDERWWMAAPSGQSNLDMPDWVLEQGNAWEEHYRYGPEAGLDWSSPRALLETAFELARAGEDLDVVVEALHPAIRETVEIDRMPPNSLIDVTYENVGDTWAAFVVAMTVLDEDGEEIDWMALGVAATIVDGVWHLLPEEHFDDIDEEVPHWVQVEIADGKAKAEQEHMFPGYEPKLTPDTIWDYRPGLGLDLEDADAPEIPDATLENLPQLLDALAYWSDRADREKGEWVDGRAWLGMDKEYVPSDAELLESWCGDLCQEVLAAYDEDEVAKFLDGEGLGSGASVTYNRIVIDHVDAMGSGRFFFASEPMVTTFVLPSLHD